MSAAPDWRFDIVGAACPQLPLRLLGLFAQQNLMPSEVTIRCANDLLDMVVVQHSLDAHRAEVVAEKMRALVMVREVRGEQV